MPSLSFKQHAVTIGRSVGRRPRAWTPARAIALGYQFLELTILSQPNMLQQLSHLLSGTRTIQIPRHVLNVDEFIVNLFEPLFTWNTVSNRIQVIADGRPRRVIDVGCGSGIYALALARAGSIVRCVDKNPVCLEFIQFAASRLTLQTYPHSLQTRFDNALCINVLDHTLQAPLLVKEIASMLKPHGRLFVHADFHPDGRHVSDQRSITRLFRALA
jgi:SAM-dependent methyltransferase